MAQAKRQGTMSDTPTRQSFCCQPSAKNWQQKQQRLTDSYIVISPRLWHHLRSSSSPNLARFSATALRKVTPVSCAKLPSHSSHLHTRQNAVSVSAQRPVVPTSSGCVRDCGVLVSIGRSANISQASPVHQSPRVHDSSLRSCIRSVGAVLERWFLESRCARVLLGAATWREATWRR